MLSRYCDGRLVAREARQQSSDRAICARSEISVLQPNILACYLLGITFVITILWTFESTWAWETA